MKVLVISDIHGNIFGLRTVLNDAKIVDKIICAGDITGYYPFVDETIDEMKKNKIISVRGNHDQYLMDGKAPLDKSQTVKDSVLRMKKLISPSNLSDLKTLPDFLNLDIDGKKVLVYHGSPWNYLEERVYPDYQYFDKFKSVDADVVILGHTHYPLIKKIGNLTLVNPGSCGQPRDYSLLSYVMWDTDKNRFTNFRVEWDIEGFKKTARLQGTDEKLFEVFKRGEK